MTPQYDSTVSEMLLIVSRKLTCLCIHLRLNLSRLTGLLELTLLLTGRHGCSEAMRIAPTNSLLLILRAKEAGVDRPGEHNQSSRERVVLVYTKRYHTVVQSYIADHSLDFG